MTALLFDENLSEAVLPRIADRFPRSQHVRIVLGDGASDERVWAHARDHGLVLVTRDEDFQRFSTLYGAPPKVLLLALHNATNQQVVALLQDSLAAIHAFVADEDAALLVLGARD